MAWVQVFHIALNAAESLVSNGKRLWIIVSCKRVIPSRGRARPRTPWTVHSAIISSPKMLSRANRQESSPIFASPTRLEHLERTVSIGTNEVDGG